MMGIPLFERKGEIILLVAGKIGSLDIWLIFKSHIFIVQKLITSVPYYVEVWLKSAAASRTKTFNVLTEIYLLC